MCHLKNVKEVVEDKNYFLDHIICCRFQPYSTNKSTPSNTNHIMVLYMYNYMYTIIDA